MSLVVSSTVSAANVKPLKLGVNSLTKSKSNNYYSFKAPSTGSYKLTMYDARHKDRSTLKFVIGDYDNSTKEVVPMEFKEGISGKKDITFAIGNKKAIEYLGNKKSIPTAPWSNRCVAVKIPKGVKVYIKAFSTKSNVSFKLKIEKMRK